MDENVAHDLVLAGSEPVHSLARCWPSSSAGKHGDRSYLIEGELPEGTLDRFFVLRLAAKPVRVTDTTQVKDALPAVEYALMVHRVGERPCRRADDAMERQFGLKGIVFCLTQGEIAVVERVMPLHEIGEQDLIGRNLTGETDTSGSWGKMTRTTKIWLAMGGIPPLIPGPEGIYVRPGPLADASLHLLGHPLIGGPPLPRLIHEVAPRIVKARPGP